MQTIQEAVASVQNAPGSMYTREDVISLLNKISIPEPSEQVASGLTNSQIEDLCRQIVVQIKDNADNLDSDIIDKDSAEFSINSNYVELDCVEFDTSEIARQVVDGIGDVIETFFENLEEDSE